MKGERPAALGGALPPVEKLNERIELVIDKCFVERRERDGLRQARAGLNEDEFGLDW